MVVIDTNFKSQHTKLIKTYVLTSSTKKDIGLESRALKIIPHIPITLDNVSTANPTLNITALSNDKDRFIMPIIEKVSDFSQIDQVKPSILQDNINKHQIGKSIDIKYMSDKLKENVGTRTSPHFDRNLNSMSNNNKLNTLIKKKIECDEEFEDNFIDSKAIELLDSYESTSSSSNNMEPVVDAINNIPCANNIKSQPLSTISFKDIPINKINTGMIQSLSYSELNKCKEILIHRKNSISDIMLDLVMLPDDSAQGSGKNRVDSLKLDRSKLMEFIELANNLLETFDKESLNNRKRNLDVNDVCIIEESIETIENKRIKVDKNEINLTSSSYNDVRNIGTSVTHHDNNQLQNVDEMDESFAFGDDALLAIEKCFNGHSSKSGSNDLYNSNNIRQDVFTKKVSEVSKPLYHSDHTVPADISLESDTNSHKILQKELEDRSSRIKDVPPATFNLNSRPERDILRYIKEYSVFKKPEYSYPWSKDVRKALVQVFKLKRFRQSQLDAINTTLNGQHCFVLMPTGGGKSLCYQLPAIIDSGRTRGVTVVVSPLLSLIKDQVDHLVHHFNIPAVAFTGDTEPQLKSWISSELLKPSTPIRIVYTTPEMLVSSRHFSDILQSLYDRGLFSRFVVDEAHCVSTWGHDFRPKYTAIGPERQRFPQVPVLALTATANHAVRSDVISCLGIHGCVTLEQSFNRPNLKYEIVQKDSNMADGIANFINTYYPKECGIIYCLSQKDCEDMSSKLGPLNVSVAYYHAGMQPEDKMAVQEQWANNTVKVICATIAFGMGIDKADVRFVIHSSLPSSLEGYYQETGRAGRDGKESLCRLYYSYRDFQRHSQMISKQVFENETSQRVRQLKERLQNRLLQVLSYCENKMDCRRVLLLGHFGEEFEKVRCNRTCDNCVTSVSSITKNVIEDICNIINIVKKLEFDKLTLNFCHKVFRGQKSKDILQRGWDRKSGSYYGTGSSLSSGVVDSIMRKLVTEKIIIEKFETSAQGFSVGYIHTTPKAQEILSNKPDIYLTLPTITSKPNSNYNTSSNNNNNSGKSKTKNNSKDNNNSRMSKRTSLNKKNEFASSMPNI